MIYNLPRKLLWADKKNISEFLSDELGNEIVSVFSLAKSHITTTLASDTLLKMYNEAFYLSTRVVYEQDENARPESYMAEILKDEINEELAELVLYMLYVILLRQSDNSKEIQHFISKLQKEYFTDTPSRLANLLHKGFVRFKKIGYRLPPRPASADELQKDAIDWCIITQGFSKHIITEILDLWDDDNEKGKVIRLIEPAYTSRLNVTKENEAADIAVEDFFEQQKSLYIVTNEEKDVNAVEDELFKDGIDKEYVREKVKDLVQEFYQCEDVNLALIELVLFKYGLLKKFNKHHTFVTNLKNWGQLSKKQDKYDTIRIANNMSSKFRDLKKNKKVENILKYEEWSKELDERKKCISIEKKLVQLMNWQAKV